ncbi:putative LRR receptor-like serine/threonine-protein kinase IRK [Diplonema papillatum]|nr:putative LRR receptor-like serine/threonine-protein kinase IRK [Diplonema papillatum]
MALCAVASLIAVAACRPPTVASLLAGLTGEPVSVPAHGRPDWVCFLEGIVCARDEATGKTYIAAVNLPGKALHGFIPDTPCIEENDSPAPVGDPGDLSLLRAVVLYNNSITGVLPRWLLYGLPRLEVLDVCRNRLAGAIPGPPGPRPSRRALKELCLCGNNLSGQVPFGVLSGVESSLRHLLLQGNELTGPLPPLAGLRAVEVVDVSNNGFSGPLPALGDHPRLAHFLAGNNRLVGTLPHDFADFGTLRQLVVSNNSLDGDLPAAWAVPGAALEVLLLDRNRLGGTLPAAFANFKQLRVASFSHNPLSGGIPSTFAGLPRLEELDVEGTGDAASFSSSSSLRVLQRMPVLRTLRGVDVKGAALPDFEDGSDWGASVVRPSEAEQLFSFGCFIAWAYRLAASSQWPFRKPGTLFDTLQRSAHLLTGFLLVFAFSMQPSHVAA